MLKSIRIVNFKGFEDCSIDIKPLTVLVGANSAGKSSFAQALIGLTQASRYGSGMLSLDKPKGVQDELWPVDLGTAKTLLHEGATGRIGIGLSVQVEQRPAEVLFEFGGPESSSLTLTRFRLGDPGSFPASTVGLPVHPGTATLSVTTTTGVQPTDEPPRLEMPNVRLDLIRNEPTARIWRNLITGEEGRLTTEGLSSVTWQHLSGTMVEVESGALFELRSLLANLKYVSPNKIAPWRVLPARDEAVDSRDVRFDGRWAAECMVRHGPGGLTLKLPPELPLTPAEAERLLNKPWEESYKTRSEWLNFFLARLHVASSAHSRVSDDEVTVGVALPNSDAERSLPDVGYGLSQVLPVLVQGLLLEKGELFVAEQPESQLHPRPQAALADFFCALAASGRQALVETHSEAFFHRLRLWAALNPDFANLVAIYFIDEADRGKCCPPRPVDITGANRWPKGFLSETLEGERALRSVYAAKARRGETR